jgi:hypothetical protein
MHQGPGTPTAVLDAEEHRVASSPVHRSGARHPVLGWSSLVTRLIGALAVLVVGIVHVQAYGGPYAAVPTIGELFIVNFIAATAIGVALLLPLERLLGRWANLAVVLVTSAGVALAAVSLAMLIISERGTLFGFHEPGYDPQAISRSRFAEIVAIALLGASLALRAARSARPRW